MMCSSNVRTIYIGYEMFDLDHGRPPSREELMDYLNDNDSGSALDAWTCPLDNTGDDFSYEIVVLTPEELASDDKGRVVVIQEHPGHHDGGYHVGYLDGSVEFIEDE